MPMKGLKDFAPEEMERLSTLLKRSDALNNAYAIVLDAPHRYPEDKAEMLGVLSELSNEADEAVDRYRAELGLPKPTA